MSEHILQAGQNVTAEATFQCPVCTNAIPHISLKLSIQNLAMMSMILWSHEEPTKCPSCGTNVIPLIVAFDINNLKWAISPIISQEKSLIETPTNMDISKIRTN